MTITILNTPYLSSKLKLTVLTSLLLFWGSQHVHASKVFYKWTDANGVVNYSANPPLNNESTVVRATNIHGITPSKQNEAAENTRATDDPPTTKSNIRCEWGKKVLKTLNESTNVSILDEGATEPRLLNKDERSERKAEAQAAVKTHC